MARLHKISSHLEQELNALEKKKKTQEHIIRKNRKTERFYLVIGLFCFAFQIYLLTCIPYSWYVANLLNMPDAIWPFLKCIFPRLWPICPMIVFLALQEQISRDISSKRMKNRELENDIGVFRAGIQGEDQMAAFLTGLPDQYDVLQNLYVTWEDKESEMDFLVIGPTGIFALEVKNYNGEILGDASEKELLHITAHKTKTFYNPVRQLRTQIHNIAHLLRNEDYPVWVDGIVVFIGDASVSINNQTTTPIFQKDQCSELYQYIVEHTAKVPLQPQMQREIVAFLKWKCQEPVSFGNGFNSPFRNIFGG